MRLRTLVLLVVFPLLATPALAQPTIFLVRHAERADSGSGAPPAMATDPDLSEVGRARAEALAHLLKDANITAIFTTEYKRTQQTAVPLAKLRGLTPTAIKSADNQQLIKSLTGATGNVLVIGHSNTIPGIIKALGVPPPSEIGDAEFDNLYVVTLGAAPTIVRLHYK